jgi:hypothetical protein
MKFREVFEDRLGPKISCDELGMDAMPGSPEEDELDLLCLLIERYEEVHRWVKSVVATRFRIWATRQLRETDLIGCRRI